MENREKTFWERLKHTYRLVVMNNETFEEVGSYRLSLLNVYVLLSTLVVLVGILMWMLITYTPLKRYIPGYSGEVGNQQELVFQLSQKLEKLEIESAHAQTYIESMRRMITQDVDTLVEEPEAKTTNIDEERYSLPSEDELYVRDEIKIDDIAQIAQNWVRPVNYLSGKPLEQFHFISPVSGEVLQGFSREKRHLGVDVIAPKNTAIRAVLDGYVFFADWTLETGNVIGIQHANNTISFYKHNSVLLKEEGSYIKAGEAVAIIGDTGTKTSGPHLHFELWHNGQPVDPTVYISF